MTYSRVFSWSAVAALVFLAMPGASAQSQTTPAFTLDMAATATQELSLTVPAPVTLPLKIIHSGGPAPVSIAVDVSATPNAQGLILPVSISIDSAPDTGATHAKLDAFTQSILPVNLHVKAFPGPGKYAIQLIVTTPATPQAAGSPQTPGTTAQSTIWRFNLTSASEVRPAMLVVDQNAVTLTGAQGLCLVRSKGWCVVPDDDPIVTVHVRDKTGNWPLADVMARMEPGLKAPGHGFNTTSQLITKFNGSDPIDIFKSPASSDRTIPVRGQGTVTLRFSQLEPGEYTIPLRFIAVDSAEDDLQKLTVTLQVRTNPLLGAAVLLFAAAFSFFATRVVSTLRQRAAFLGRVRALRPAWLANESPILPVIWLRSTLRLAESLSSQFWLTGQSELDTRLDAAAAMLAILDRVRQVRGRIHTSIREPMVLQRAIWKLNNLVGKLGAAPLKDEDVAYFKAQLDKFDDWCDSDQNKWEAAYWADLLPVIQARHAEAEAASFPDAAAQKLAEKLRDLLKEAIDARSLSLGDKIKAEANYQRLAILLELCHRERSDLVKDLGTPEKMVPIEKVRAVVDDAWWKLLKDNLQVTPKVVGPPGTLDPPEAYEIVTFQVDTPKKPFLRDTYLMQNKLKYRWTITIYDKDKVKAGQKEKAKERGKLNVVSLQPQVAQYSPYPGKMVASVEIEYEGEKGLSIPESEPVQIIETTDFSVFSKYERTDFYAFFLAAAASIASGMALYVLKPTFVGSLQDYLTLFTWGASVDQGKNFLQSLGAYSATTNKPAS